MRKYLIYYVVYFLISRLGIWLIEQNTKQIDGFFELLGKAISVGLNIQNEKAIEVAIFIILVIVLLVINYNFIFRPDHVINKIKFLLKKGIRKKYDSGYDLKSLSSLSITPDLPQGFGYKIAWIAIPGTPETFFKDVDCTNMQVANWKTGLNFTLRDNPSYVFVTPAVSNWFFVVSGNDFDGNIQFDSSETSGECTENTVGFLNRLASRIPNFFSFYSYRTSGHYSFCKIQDRKLNRALAYGDGVIEYNFGAYTEEEIELGIDKKIEYCRTEDLNTNDTDIDAELMLDESDIINLCAKYCLNTLGLENYASNPSTGWVCKINY